MPGIRPNAHLNKSADGFSVFFCFFFLRGDMDKRNRNLAIDAGQVKCIVADISPGVSGDLNTVFLFLHLLYDLRNRERRGINTWTVRYNAFRSRCVSFIIRNPSFPQVNCLQFRCHGVPASGFTQQKNVIRRMLKRCFSRFSIYDR